MSPSFCVSNDSPMAELCRLEQPGQRRPVTGGVPRHPAQAEPQAGSLHVCRQGTLVPALFLKLPSRAACTQGSSQ